MHEFPELSEVNQRLQPLLRELRRDGSPCPFMVDQDAATRVALSHYSGGRDANYVLVSRKWDGKNRLPDVEVAIRYAPFVEGTAIIYDLIDETMQGKARPFVCNLGQRSGRIYAVLPYQIEETALCVKASGGGRHLRVAFLDARGEPIQAALPFELRLVGADEALVTEYRATDRMGQFSYWLDANSSANKVVVRSLITGRQESLDF